MEARETVMLSALAQWGYCPRRCGLIHVESVWKENLYTLKGRHLHERADSEQTTWEGGVRVERGLPLFSDALGLVGKADVVEFHPDGSAVPVEYKSGPRRESLHDDLQVCGQALCLEEMLDRPVLRGAIFSLQSRRRREVLFTEELRQATREAIAAVREMLTASQTLPPALNDGRCPKCSLLDACVPATVVAARAAWHRRHLFTIEEVTP